MIALTYTPAAVADLEKVATFLLEVNASRAQAAVREIIAGLRVLELHPYIGRRVRGDVRELVISFGRAGYVAMYRVTVDGVQVLAIRHQREAGGP